MELPKKPECYDAVPACLCTQCQLYDVLCAKSSSLPTSSSFLPSRYAASLSSSPAATCAVSSVLFTRPSCSVAVSTCVLANIDVPPRRPSRVRHRFDFAVSSPSFMSPVSSAAPVAVSSSSVAISPSSVAVSSSHVKPSSVESSSAVASSSPVCSVPVTPVLPSRSMSSVPPRVRPAPVWFRPVLPSRPIRYVAPPPRLPPCPSLLPRVPLVCLLVVAVPVLFATPFGFVLSFLLR